MRCSERDLEVGHNRYAEDASCSGQYVVIVVGGCNVINVGHIFDIRLDAQDLGESKVHCRIQSHEARQEHGVVKRGVHAAAMNDTQAQAQQGSKIVTIPHREGVLRNLRYDRASAGTGYHASVISASV